MSRVTAYKASDDSLHLDKKAYLAHESNLVVAKKLRSIIGGLVNGATPEEKAATANDVHDFIVNGIGLNTLRELFAFKFVPGAEDGDGAGAGTGAPVGNEAAAAGDDAAPAPAAGEGDAAAPAAAAPAAVEQTDGI